MTLRFGIIHPRNFVNFTKCILCAMRDDSQGNYRILKPEFRRARNLGDYEGKPRITRIRADKYIRGDWPIRAYPRNCAGVAGAVEWQSRGQGQFSRELRLASLAQTAMPRTANATYFSPTSGQSSPLTALATAEQSPATATSQLLPADDDRP